MDDFAAFIQSKLSELRDEEAYTALKELEKCGNVDKACGTGLTTALLSNLGKKQISVWIKVEKELTVQFQHIDFSGKSLQPR